MDFKEERVILIPKEELINEMEQTDLMESKKETLLKVKGLNFIASIENSTSNKIFL